jgi:hypothetical protein
LIATEDPKHVQMIVYLWKKMPPDLPLLLEKLREERDPFIASRINSTLQNRDTGILFLGKDHEIADKLDADITVYGYFDY